MNTGQMTSKITYKTSASESETDYGGVSVTFGASVSLRAKARQLSYNKLLSYGLPATAIGYEFTVWHDSVKTLVVGSLITFGGVDYMINQVVNENERNRVVKIIATKRA